MTKINFTNNSIKLLQTSLFIVLITSLSTIQSYSYANADPQINPQTVQSSCVDRVEQQMHSLASTLNNAKAISLANSQNEFKSEIQGYTYAFNSIFNTWSFDSNCNVTWQAVNVVYTLSNASGYVKTVVVTMDPELTKMVSVSEQIGKHYGSSPNWSGYEFQGNSGATNPVYEAYNSWSEPTVSVPYTGGCVTPQTCDVAIWAGLADAAGASNGNLAQDGTDAQVTCAHSICNNQYFAWYEFLPNNAVTCTGVTVSHGDSISADVVNTSKPGSSYNISVVDSTSSTSCSVTGYTYSAMTTPEYGDFIAERATLGSGYETLAKFNTPTPSPGGTIYYSGATQFITTPYGNGWYIQDTMVNSGNTNINLGAVTPSSTFTETWSTSSGT
jgi:YHS domain-containing protein